MLADSYRPDEPSRVLVEKSCAHPARACSISAGKRGLAQYPPGEDECVFVISVRF